MFLALAGFVAVCAVSLLLLRQDASRTARNQVDVVGFLARLMPGWNDDRESHAP